MGLSIKSVITILSRIWGHNYNYGLWTVMDVFYDIRLCRELAAIAHPIPVHCTPGLSKYVIVIVVEYPLVVVIAHGPAQINTERLVKAVRPHALPLGRGRGH